MADERVYFGYGVLAVVLWDHCGGPSMERGCGYGEGMYKSPWVILIAVLISSRLATPESQSAYIFIVVQLLCLRLNGL